MDPNPVVFDISSDEEPAWEELRGDDCDWFSDVLISVAKELDDSDDVVVVDEINPPTKAKPSKQKVKDTDFDDDDCIILDGDPDKPMGIAENSMERDADELLIVGQKGQIACRDFPHPRHDCAKFPFGSTPHEKYCELCHCFVCDTRAPCGQWASGNSNVDHCHANDKMELWKTLRKVCRSGGETSSVNPEVLVSQHVIVPQSNRPVESMRQMLNNRTPLNQVVGRTTIRRPQNELSGPATVLAGNCAVQNQVSRPSKVRTCLSTMRRGNANNSGPFSRNQMAGRNSSQLPSFGQKSLGVHNAGIQKNQGLNTGNLGSHCVSFPTMAKRVDAGVAATRNQTAYLPAQNVASTQTGHFTPNPSPVAAPNTGYNMRQLNIYSRENMGRSTLQNTSQPQASSVFTSAMPSQLSPHDQLIPQSKDCQIMNQPQIQRQSSASNGFADSACNLVDSANQSSQPSSVKNSQLPIIGLANEERSFSELNGITNYSFDDFDLERFFLESQSVPMIPEGSVSSELNSMPPETASFDAGLLFFDFETSWSGLTHV